jgi:hypothetical protein
MAARSVARSGAGLRFTIRVDEVLKQAIEKAAHDDTRSITSYVERIIVENLRTKGYLKK